MKAKKTFILIIVIFFMAFMILYLGSITGYYKYESSKKWTLTKNAITKYEKDLAEGKEIEVKNYLQEEKNYSNKASKLGCFTSNIIEESFNIIVKSMFNQIGKEINKKD